MSDPEVTIDYEEKKSFAVDLVANMTEKTVKESADDPDSFEKPYNPDEIYKSTGDYTVYESMMQDDQIDSAMQLKKDLVLGSGWEIEHEDQEISDIITRCLTDDQQVPFEDRLEEILTAYENGFSLTEKIFGKKEGKLFLKSLKTRHPNTWLMDQDEKGAVTKYLQRAKRGDKEIRHSSLIHYVNRPKYQNPFGTSDLKSAHTAWRIKLEVLKFWAIFLEKAASPTPVGKYPDNTPKEARDKLFSALKKLQNKSAMVIPESMVVEFLESKNKGEAYEKAIDLLNLHIGRALMIPDLLGYSGSETSGGSFSLGENQMNVFFMHINRRRKTLEQTINHHIIRPLTVFNIGFLDDMPKFKFKPIKQEDTEQMAKLWIEAVNGKFYKPSEEEVNHFRESIQFPQGEVEFIDNDPNSDINGQENDPKNNKENPEDPKADPDAPEKKEDEDREDFVFKPTEGEFKKRVDFRAIKSQMDASESSIMDAGNPIIQDMVNQLVGKLDKKKIISDKQVDRIDSLKVIKKKDLNNLLKKQLTDTYLRAKQGAEAELFRQNFAKLDIEEDFLEFLEREITFYVGDVEAAMLKDVRQDAIQAIRDGMPFNAVESFIKENLTRKQLVSLERWARTKTTEVFNRGRLDFFNSSDVVSGYQFSAILDGRTTVICAGLHGKKFKKGTEPVCPLHFNCRSLLIPLTRFEDWKEDTTVGGTVATARAGDISIPKKTIDKHIEDNIGKGFSRR